MNEGREPVHRRSIELEVFERDDEFDVIGRLRDDRPWAGGTAEVEHLHDMELQVTVAREDLTIVAATATMHRYPHAECTDIVDAFRGLVGLSVARGYSRAVQERFGRALGCSHLEFLARAIGPAVVQAVPSSVVRARHEDPAGGGQFAEGFAAQAGTRLADTCHVWATDGPGPEKVALGWRPARGEYPAPRVEVVRRRTPS